MRKVLCFFISLLAGFAGVPAIIAEVRLPAIFGDHMVLQQDQTLPVWGWADPGEKVKVTIDTVSVEVTTGSDGRWRADLPPLSTTTVPVRVIISGKNTITLADVLIGDVWLCSGQSNMLFGLRKSFRGKEEAKQADYPKIRLFFVVKSGTAAPSDSVAEAPSDSLLQGKWQVCTPETVSKIGDFTDQDEGGFSAVGYVFAKAIHRATKRPVGMIGSYMGGTNASAWTSLAGLKKEPALTSYVQKLAASSEDQRLFYSIKWADYVAARRKWMDAFGKAYGEQMQQWSLAAQEAGKEGKPLPPKPEPPEPKPRNPNSIYAPPASLFNGMIAPLIPYALKGALWYQGEANTDNGREYGILLPALINDWRSHWGQGDFPFLFVQLPNCNEPPRTAGEFSPWAVLRESQLKTLALPNTGMAVTIDIGAAGLHPPDKIDVGLRLAQAARHAAYGENIVYTGPLYEAAKVESGKIRVSFKPDSLGGGLIIGSAPWTDPKAVPVSKTELKGFVLAGEDKAWVWADAKVEGDTVLVSCPQVTNPVAVRYAWANNPACNLYNKEGLPAAPFRSDTWEDNPPPAGSPAVAK